VQIVEEVAAPGSPPRSASRGSEGSAPASPMTLMADGTGGSVKKLTQTAWTARGALARDLRGYTVLMATMAWSLPGRFSKVVSNPKLHQLFAEEEDTQALAGVLCGCSGALCLGSGGAVIGATVGGASGLAVGAVPAIFTFGLSLPIGAVVGGAIGFCTGAAVGGGAGLGAGATSGMTVAYFGEEIKYITLNVASRIYDVYDFILVRPVTVVRLTGRTVGNSLMKGRDLTKAKAFAVGNWAAAVTKNPSARASMLGAGAGGAALGTAGAASGAILGGTAGAAVGLVPALFTFGLSIPIGAVIGGSAGLCTGATVGATVGTVGGGVTGYAAYTYKAVPLALYDFARGAIGGQRAIPATAAQPGCVGAHTD